MYVLEVQSRNRQIDTWMSSYVCLEVQSRKRQIDTWVPTYVCLEVQVETGSPTRGLYLILCMFGSPD